jgi:hypothetical protein
MAAAELGMSAPGSVLAVQFHGAGCRYQVQLDAGEVWSAWVPESRTPAGIEAGSRVVLSWPQDAAVPLSQGA